MVGEKTFGTTELLALERDLSKAQPRPTTVIVDAYPYNYAWRLLYDKPPEMMFDAWTALYKAALRDLKHIRTKRIIRIGADLVVQSSDAGLRTEDVKSGTNPTVMRIDDVDIRILDIQVVPPVKPPIRSAQRPATCQLYVEATPIPSVATARVLAAHLARRIGVPTASISIRQDAWFIYETSFPVWYPFSPPSPPPNKAQYLNSPREFRCQVTQKMTRCQYGS